jgi:hypothetical protein
MIISGSGPTALYAACELDAVDCAVVLSLVGAFVGLMVIVLVCE